ncbi:MAG: succinate dehydrogenase assembly factor 2 [Polaromonas sp.]|nr:succinate dehydrogenase assembly factor 2 [Polaromonas sp.]
MTSALPETLTPPISPLLDERSLSRLRWGCRRGLLENDLFLERFFARHAASLTVRQAKGLDDLMDLSDNDLLDLFLQRKQPTDLEAVSAATDEAREVLALLIVPAIPGVAQT